MSAVTIDSEISAATTVLDKRPIILVIDDSQVCRDFVAKALRNAGFRVNNAADGKAGLAELERQTPSLILLDNEMPNMGGLEFLKTIRASSHWAALPVVMLTSSRAKEVVVQSLRYRISGYVLKENLKIPELLQRINLALKSSAALPQQTGFGKVSNDLSMSVPSLLTRDMTLSALADLQSTQLLTGVVDQIKAIDVTGKTALAEINAVTRQDPVLAARVIQMARSGNKSGGKSRVTSIDDAVRIVGVNEVCALVARTGVFNAMTSASTADIDLLRCWHHSFAVAAVMARVVPRNDRVRPGVPYMIGLCHDLAEISLRQAFPREFSAAVDFANQTNSTVHEMLPKVFGISYSEVTRAFLTQLNFPPEVAEPINEYFTCQSPSGIGDYKSLLARTLVVADMMAGALLLTSSTDQVVSPMEYTDCRSALIPSSKINTAEIWSETITSISLLAALPPQADAMLGRPLIARKPIKVLYVRHPGFAPLDPLEVAIGSLAEVQVQDRISGPDELSGFSAAVIATPGPQDSLCSSSVRMIRLAKRPISILKVNSSKGQSGVSPAAPGESHLSLPVGLKALAKFIADVK